jgi:LacI family transcriptional regulator
MRKAMEAMVDRQVDGLIFGALSARLIDLPALPDGMRAVTVNCANPEVPVAVLPDEEEAGYAMARSLIDAGHGEGIAIIGNAPVARANPRVSLTIGRRFDGIHRALDEAGVTPVAVADIEEWEPWHGFDATKEVLASGAPVTALLCLNDRVAFGAQQAMQEKGLRIPDDLSVASFDDDQIAAYMRPGLTTARLPYLEMGRKALELLLDPAPDPGEHLVEMPVQVRESIRPHR